MKVRLGRNFTLLLVILLSFSSLGILDVKAQRADSWASLAPMPTPRTGLGVAAVNGKIYAIGGSNGASLTVNEEYNPQTNTWTIKAPMPTPRSSFAIFVYQDKIHVVGGKIDSMTPTNIHQVYDPKNDTWENLPTAQALRASGFAGNIVNDKAYVISGSPSYAPPWANYDINNVYDLTFGNWSINTPIPTAVYHYASAVLDNKIFVIGGYQIGLKNGGYDLNQIYNPENDSWSLGSPIPVSVSGAGCVATTGAFSPRRIYVIGGFETPLGYAGSRTNLNNVYDPSNDQWSTGVSLPSNRSQFGLVEVDGKLYAIGGFDDNNYLSLNQKYTPTGYGTPPPNPTPTPEPEPFPTTIVLISVVIIAVVGVGIFVYFKKRKT